MRQPLPILALALLFLVAPLVAARAEEEGPTAQASYEAALATLPAPSARHAFTFEGQAFLNGSPFGTLTFKAEPTADGKAWQVADVISLGGGAYVRTYTALLDRQLQPLSGRVEGKEPGTDGFTITWTRTEADFSVKRTVTRTGEATTSEQDLEHEGTLTTTMCSLWLFARLTGVAKGSHAVTVFDSDPGQGDAAFEAATWTQGEEGAWGDRKALLLAGTKGNKHLQAGFDPRTHDLLGVRTKSEAQGFELEIRPAAAAPTGKEDELFARPARNAVEVALQAGLAFAVADLELAERVLHWPSIHAEAQTRHTGEAPFPDVETFKAASMRSLEATLTKRPRPMIEGALKMVKDQLQVEELEGGFTKVTFPPMFQDLVMVVGEIDGQWYLVRMPGNDR